jgi:hypothetical protein
MSLCHMLVYVNNLVFISVNNICLRYLNVFIPFHRSYFTFELYVLSKNIFKLQTYR